MSDETSTPNEPVPASSADGAEHTSPPAPESVEHAAWQAPAAPGPAEPVAVRTGGPRAGRWWRRRVPVPTIVAALVLGCLLGAGVVGLVAVGVHRQGDDRRYGGYDHRDGQGPDWRGGEHGDWRGGDGPRSGRFRGRGQDGTGGGQSGTTGPAIPPGAGAAGQPSQPAPSPSAS